MIDYQPYELEHISALNEIASECTLFLKREDDSFPIKDLKEVALIGNGVRHMVKGGTGSGSVDIHYLLTIEEAFKNEGIKIVSSEWLDQYDEIRKVRKEAFIKRVKKEAKAKHMNTIVYSIGAVLEEGEYDLNIDFDIEVAIYVLSRYAGEGKDRSPIKGDFYLTDTEIRTIKYLNKKHKKFLLVLNVPGVIDISPILEVKNILLLSQLGTVTAQTLVDIVLGRKNPSGKLSTSWAKREDYPHYQEFGDNNDVNYKEGIYVGYRYFTSVNQKPIFEFGYGLSYTKFQIKYKKITNEKDKITINCSIKNIGNFSGKEVVQLYLRKPSENIDNPRQILVQFAKTKELAPHEECELELSFKLSDFPTFDQNNSTYLIQGGIYYLSIGNSSFNLEEICSIEISENIELMKVNYIDSNLTFEEDKIYLKERKEKLANHIVLTIKDFEINDVSYKRYCVPIDPFVEKLSDQELLSMALGDIKGTLQSVIGESCSAVCGGAGESTLKIKGLPSISMVDGPAGLRIAKDYIATKNKKYKLSLDPLWREAKNYLPKPMHFLLDFEKNHKRKGKIFYQYTSSIPIATALAQSFNRDVLSRCGDVVREEMEMFNVDLWLAPAMNIHRNIMCGRNFEYYSEDPFLSGECAIAITKSIQKNPRKGVTLKHLFCNNQETNRMNNNSNVSMRAFREIYLYGFARVIKEAGPAAIMMSYNLINGIHSSEHYEIINDIIRCELGYKGLIISDWIATKQIYVKSSIHPCTYASRNIKGGMNICMPGSSSDVKNMKKALRKKELTRKDLLVNASIILQMIKKLKNNSLE